MALPDSNTDSNTDMTTPLQIAGVNQPQITAQPTAQPTQVQTQVQTQPTQPSPIEQHTGRFHKILSAIAGGDQQVVRDQQGNPVTGPDGRVQTRTIGKRSLGASILAGALSAMAAEQQNQPYRNGNGVWVNPSNQAVAAGEQAFQQSRPNSRVQAAQAQANNQRTQQYAVYKQNVDMFKMAHEIAQMKGADKAAAVAPFAGTYAVAEEGNIPGYDTTLGDLSEKEAGEKLSSFDPTSHMMVPNGKTVPVIDPQTHQPTGETEIRYMVLPGHDGKLPLTKEMIADHPELRGAAEGQQIPLTQWVKLVRGQASKQLLTSMFNDVSEAQNAGFPDKSFKEKSFDYNQFAKESKATPDQLSQLGHLSADRTNPDVFAANLKKIDTTGQLDAALRNQGIKIDEKAWGVKRAADEAKAKAEVRPLTQEQLQDLATNHSDTPEGKAAVNNLAGQVTQAARKSAAEAAAKQPFELRKQQQEQNLRTGTPEDAGALLANGDLTLTELKSRGSTPKFITDSVNAAKSIDPNYNAQKADAEYKIAGNQANTTFFGSANSLTDARGTLDQLAAQYKKLGNGRIPLFNKWKDYAGYQTGDPAMAGFYQTAVGVADDYAKVMGGGTGSDTSRLQVMQSFANAHNPRQMQAAIEAARAAVNSQTKSRIGSNTILQKMYGKTTGQSAAGTGQPVYARNPQTGQRVMSNDGGKTWQQAQ